MLMLADLRVLAELACEWPEGDARSQAQDAIAQGIVFLVTPQVRTESVVESWDGRS
jgi:hypothetical protein